MTVREMERTMDFILRVQADSAIRLEKLEANIKKHHDEFIKELKGFALENRKFALQNDRRERENRAYERKVRALEAADRKRRQAERRTDTRVKSMKDVLKLFNERQNLHSRRLDRLEDS